jgi:outer membrane protein TolC
MNASVRRVLLPLSLVMQLIGAVTIAQTVPSKDVSTSTPGMVTTTVSTTTGISLRTLLNLARAGAEVKAARLRLSAAEQGVKAAALPFTGTLSGGYALSSIPNSSGPGANIGLNFDLGSEAQNAARKVLADAQRAVRDTEFRVERGALERWHLLRKVQAAWATAQLALTLAERQDQLSAFRFEGGEINASERERSGLALEEARLFSQRLGLQMDDLQAQIRLIWNVDATQISLAPSKLVVPQVVEISLDTRPDIVALKTTLAETQAQLDHARRELRPTFALDGSWTVPAGMVGGSLKSDLTGSLGYSSPAANPVYGYTLRLSANLNVSPSSWTPLAPLESGVALSKQALEVVRQGAKLDVESKRRSTALSQAALVLSRRGEQIAQTQLKGVRQRAASGSVSDLDVLRAQIDVHKAAETVLAAEAEQDRTILDLYDALALPFPEMP